MATCRACNRELLLVQATAPGSLQGLCPWCGATLAPQNTSILVDATSRVEDALDELVSGLHLLLGMQTNFRLDREDIAKHLDEVLGLNAAVGVR